MPQAIVTVSFETENQEATEREIATWELPEGAFVSIQIQAPSVSGMVQDGELVKNQPPPPYEEPAE